MNANEFRKFEKLMLSNGVEIFVEYIPSERSMKLIELASKMCYNNREEISKEIGKLAKELVYFINNVDF